jgi:hypothetical protein
MYPGTGGSFYLASGYLNNEDISATLLASQAYPKGQLGKIVGYNDDLAAKLSKTNTCYNGLYQLVLSKSGSTASPARGLPAFWTTRSTFEVSPDASATLEGDFAGVYLNAPTKGQYTIIQVAGKATAQMRATVTSTAIGALVYQLSGTSTFDAWTDAIAAAQAGAGAAAVLGVKNVVGIAIEAPANGGLKLVSLWGRNLNIG